MCRQRALGAEVVSGFHEAAAEILLPDAIHDHPGCEGVVAAHDPSRQVETIGTWRRRLQRRQDGRGSRSDLVGRAGEVALVLRSRRRHAGNL